MSYDFPSQTDQTDHTSPALLPTQHATLWLCLLGSMGLAIAAWQPFSVLAKDACFLPEVSQKDSSCTTEAPRSPSGHGTSSQTEQPAKERPHLAPSVPEAEPVIAGLTLSGWQQQLNLLHPEIPDVARWGERLLILARDPHTPAHTRHQALLTWGRLGPAMSSSLPTLLRWLEELGSCDMVSTAEGRDDPRFSILRGLALQGRQGVAAVPWIIRLAQDHCCTITVRLAVIEALWRCGADEPQAVATLLALAFPPAVSPQAMVDAGQLAAMEALGLVGSSAASARPRLIRYLTHPQREVRRVAVEALGRLQPQHAAELEAVVTLWFEDEAEDVRDAAEEALVRCGARIVGEMVVPWLQHDDADIRLRVARLFRRWGRGWGPFWPALQATWDDPDPWVRYEALLACWAEAPDVQPIVRRLLTLLTVEDNRLRRQVWQHLRQHRKAVLEQHDLLADLQGHPDRHVRYLVQRLLRPKDAGSYRDLLSQPTACP